MPEDTKKHQQGADTPRKGSQQQQFDYGRSGQQGGEWRPDRQDQDRGNDLPDWNTDRDNDPDGDRIGR